MGQRFLMDTNVVIGHFGNQFPLSAANVIDELPCIISVITRIEFMGWYSATPTQLAKLKPFIDNAQIITLNEEVIGQTIILRQQYKIKLPDAIVAATALVNNFCLLTRNTDDFKNINNLIFDNPWLW